MTDERKRGFLIHLFVYVAVNALLIVVNLLYQPNNFWFLYPLIGWGLLLTAHGYATFRRKPQGRKRTAPASSAARTGAKP